MGGTGSGSHLDKGLEWTKATRSGREKGAWVYLDITTLAKACAQVGIDPAADLEIRRYPANGEGQMARVILKIRKREVPADAPP